MPKNVAKKTPLEKDFDGELKMSMAEKSDVTPTDRINGLNVRNNPTSAAGLLNDLSPTLADWPEMPSNSECKMSHRLRQRIRTTGSEDGETGGDHGTVCTGLSCGPDAAIFSVTIAGACVGIFILPEITPIVDVCADAFPSRHRHRTIGWGREYSSIGKDGQPESFLSGAVFSLQVVSH